MLRWAQMELKLKHSSELDPGNIIKKRISHFSQILKRLENVVSQNIAKFLFTETQRNRKNFFWELMLLLLSPLPFLLLLFFVAGGGGGTAAAAFMCQWDM